MTDGNEMHTRCRAYYTDPNDVRLFDVCWADRPWMVDAFTGSSADREPDRFREIREWCTDHFGPESWPIHGKPGRWYVGSATVHGWTWMGFDTEDAMNAFVAAWPTPAVADVSG